MVIMVILGLIKWSFVQFFKPTMIFSEDYGNSSI